jgi:hypothetical protein
MGVGNVLHYRFYSGFYIGDADIQTVGNVAEVVL